MQPEELILDLQKRFVHFEGSRNIRKGGLNWVSSMIDFSNPKQKLKEIKIMIKYARTFILVHR